MNRIKAVFRKLSVFLNSHSSYRKPRTIVLVLFGWIVMLIVVNGLMLPSRVWLPQIGRDELIDPTWPPTTWWVWNLPVKQEVIITKYGRAIRYAASADWNGPRHKDSDSLSVAYTFRASPLLRASNCPNISNIEETSPSACDKIGTFQGHPVYAKQRSLASADADYYLTIGRTFIYVRNDEGDQPRNLSYLNYFVPMQTDEVDAYLAENRQYVDKVKANRRFDSSGFYWEYDPIAL